MTASAYPIITIKKQRVPAVRRRHPWIFSGAIAKMENVQEGSVVRCLSPRGDYLATGYYHDGSIAIRILSFEDEPIDATFWSDRIGRAFRSRQRLGFPSSRTDAFRLVHGEGDGIPGLIVDVYGTAAVIQCHTGGMTTFVEAISEAVRAHCPFISSIYVRGAGVVDATDDQLIHGEASEIIVSENGHRFKIDVLGGQKTGFFLDQRDNRQLLGSYAKGCSVLNLYAYTGGFSIYALNAGASEVVSVDISEKAVQLLKENVNLNGSYKDHEGLAVNVHDYLKEMARDRHDIIVLDPPAFAKSHRKRHNAVQAYKRINMAAMGKIKSGGLLFTFSCSQVVDSALFYNTITSAAMEVGREAKVLHRLSQGADHPVSLFHPEGEYLKGLVVEVT